MTTTGQRTEERMVVRAFERLTARRGAPVRWRVMADTPVGPIGLAEGGKGLVRVAFAPRVDDFFADLLYAFRGRPVVEGALDGPRRALDRYFAGTRFDFDVAVDLSQLGDFDRKVLHATARIPAGRVKSYRDVAREAGNARASRAAGNALHRNPVAIIVPCHRVLRSDGSLGGYGGGLPIKEWLLKHEGALLV
jgi:methylated-DNA-[protein]-cysteine S-methyltransferase